MKLIYIDELLENLKLNMPNLEVSHPDAKFYKTMLLQPKGEIIAGDYFVRNKDKDITYNKLINFFKLALSETVELAITPEYSCPWSVIESLINQNILPNEKNIWVIGAESITQREFLEFTEKYNNIYWIYENELFSTIQNDKFLDPVCYFFKTYCKIDNVLKTVAIVQFKTNPMAGTDFERDNLLLGNIIYAVRNGENSINLSTIICSDALEFEVDKFLNVFQPYLLIHIQLNKEPFNNTFSDYRENYYKKNKECNKNILTLNWAHKTKLLSDELLFGGSAIYTKCQKVNVSDERINKNHEKGLYYTYWSPVYTNAFYLNYDECVFTFENTKVSQVAATPQNQNSTTGPKMKSLYKWDDNWISISSASDYFSNACSEVEIDFSSINVNTNEFVNIERLILLSIGLICDEEHLKPKNLKSFKVESGTNEVVKRYTFAQHPDNEGKEFRCKSLIKFGKLVHSILNEQDKFPINIEDLVENYEIKYDLHSIKNSCYFNVYSKDKGTPATVIFLGYESEGNAKKIFDKVSNLLKDSQSDCRLVVWYETATGIKSCFRESKPKITKSQAIKKYSFRKGD